MDYQNAEFYKLNKNNPDLVYNFADELITYRKETDENGNLQIVEYRKKDGRKGKKATTRRVVPSTEMSIEDFDAWKTRLTEEALEYRRNDDLTTRENSASKTSSKLTLFVRNRLRMNISERKKKDSSMLQ